ncbi:MAG: carboxypeptidase regulatory-like domain-containing protein [Pyrinomonadaceae bacterium]|nr:carboxypeptidase regulatory-like domain-containing protein [Pyrinomonadaceae bacterium]
MNSSLKNLFRTPQLSIRRARPLIIFLILLLIATSAANAQTTPRQPSENQQPDSKAGSGAPHTGTITGRVLADEGHPVANAAVIAFGLNAGGPPAGDTTDADGKFEVKNLRPGAYNVQVNAPGYVVVPDPFAEFGAPRLYRVGETANFTLVKGGVITGTVTDSNGEPVIAATVRPIRVRKPTERLSAVLSYAMPRTTDDRGIYRLYGLEPGVYVIAIGGSAQAYGSVNAYDGDAPTYYPSATRDTAAELTVRAGEELTGIDVRYRGERGHTLSGFVSGQPSDPNSRSGGISIMLTQAASGTMESFTFVQGEDGNRSFALTGAADGEYFLTAMRNVNNTNEALTAVRKVSVRGADVTGLELKLEPLGALSGNVILEPPPKADCRNQRDSTLEEIVINTRRDTKAKNAEEDTLPSLAFRRMRAMPNAKGEFRLHNLRDGSHRLDVQLPGEDWYVRSIALPVAPVAQTRATAAQSKTTTPGAFTLKPGERLSGVTITVGQGAATLRGRVAQAAEGAMLPANLRVHLVPVEAERATDALRYMETSVESDGKFALGGIAPGRYWILARIAPAVNENENDERRPLVFDAAARDKLRREAESAELKIDLQPCQRLADYVLNYDATPQPKQPSVK